jgi:TonB family protein
MNDIMKRILLAILALALTIPLNAQYMGGSYKDLEDSETVSALKEHVAFLSSTFLEGRAPGSEGELEAAVYLTEIFDKYGLDVLSGPEGDEFGVMQESGDTLTSRNVIAYIPGYDANLRNNYIVIGARLDNIGTSMMTVDGESRRNIYYGANGNASGVAILAELAKRLSTNALLMRRSILLVGFGASTQSYAGAWYFLNRAFTATDKIDAMINLDMLGTGNRGFYAYTSSNADMNALLQSVNTALHPIVPELTSAEPFASDHRAFYDKEIPSVYFTTGRYPEWSSVRDVPSLLDYDNMERELEYIYNFSVSLINGPKLLFRPEANPGKSLAPTVIPYYDCTTKPSFLNSYDPKVFLEQWVYKYLKYPDEAVNNGIQGQVLVGFVIDEKGKITDVQVLKGVDELLDQEAVRVIAASPTWKPGTLNGKKIKASMSLYVEFRLEKR